MKATMTTTEKRLWLIYWIAVALVILITALSSCIKIYDCPDQQEKEICIPDTLVIHDTIEVPDTVEIPIEVYAVMDYDGNGYRSVTIGDQTWLRENLQTTHYRDGELIPLLEDRIDWGQTDQGAMCWYDKDQDLGYGALYNKWAVYTTRLCPTGWHVPSDDEWNKLVGYLGGEYLAAGKLKEAGLDHWMEPNEGATNESGFTALPGGGLFSVSGSWPFYYAGREGYWWTSTIPEDRYQTSTVIEMAWGSTQVNFYKNGHIENYGFSVRCIKNQEP